jgi:hypothetical protein
LATQTLYTTLHYLYQLDRDAKSGAELVELDSERLEPYVRGYSDGNSLCDVELFQDVLKSLPQGGSWASMVKMVR